MEYTVIFHTHFDALQYRRFLNRENIKNRLQPVPRSLSSSCGTCVKFWTDEKVSKKSMFAEHELDKIFECSDDKYILVVEKE